MQTTPGPDRDAENHAQPRGGARAAAGSRAAQIAGLVAAALTALTALPSLVALGDVQPPPVAAAPAPAIASAPPSAAGVMWAFRAARVWADAWSTAAGAPAWPDDAGAGPTGCSVHLREDGLLLGRGSAVATEPTPPADLLRAAVAAALAEANSRRPGLGQRALEARGPDAAPGATRLLLSVELAGPLTPISPEDPADLDVLLAPGLDGLAVRVGSGRSGRIEAAFPGAMLAEGQTASRAAQGLVSRLTGRAELGVERPRVLRERHGVEFFKFPVAHAASNAPGAPPIFLVRGQRYVSPREVESASRLRAWGDELARGLARRLGPGGTVSAVVRPAPGAVQPADRAERALAALALAEYAADALSAPVGPGDARARLARAPVAAARAASVSMLLATGEPEAEPGSASDTAAACLSHQAALALIRSAAGRPEGETQQLAALAERSLRSVRAALDAPAQPQARPLPGAVRALIARSLTLAGDPGATEAVAALTREAEPASMVTLMPWLAWAVLDAPPADPPAGAGAPLPLAARLRQVRSLVWSYQLGAAQSAVLGMDTEGGVAFTAGGSVLPTWHTARPLGALAAMLADARLTSAAERPAEIGRLLAGLRFLRQLTADESVGWMAVDAEALAGGVRAAPWDASQPIDASAMTLLAVLRSAQALDALAGRPAPVSTPPAPSPGAPAGP